MRALLIALLLPCAAPAQEFFTLKGHGGPIMDIAVAPDGRIATASFDNSVGLWEGETPRWFEGHRAAVNAVVFAGEGLLSGGDDNGVLQWHGMDGLPDPGQRLEAHTAKVTDIAVAASGSFAATASWDGTIGLVRLPDLSQGSVRVAPRSGPEPLRFRGHEQGVNAVAFSRDDRLLYSGSSDGTIRVWTVEDQTVRQVLVRHGFGINELVLGDGWLAYGAVDGVTRVIDPDSGAPIKDFTLGRRPILAMAHDGVSQLAIGDGEGFIMVIDTQDWAITRDFRATRQGPVWALAFSPDGQNIHAGGLEDIVYSWPVETMDKHGPMSSETRSFLQDPATLPNGERQFKRKCSICHSLTEGSERKAGPTLYGLFGRAAGAVEDYSYSEILSGSGIVWTAETIDGLFDEGPDHYIPGTKMPMQRIVEQSDRDDLIAYLQAATKGEE